MNNIYKLLFFISIILIGCKVNDKENIKISQSMNSLNMNIFSNKGKKLLSIKSPYSNYDQKNNTLNIQKSTISLFKDNLTQYIINSDNSKLINNNQILELYGNVIVQTVIEEDDKLYANSFIWNIKKSEYLLLGNVKFVNDSITLSSDKAVLNKNDNIIEFFKPVKYKIMDNINERNYEINSENAYYNIKTKSVFFTSKQERVRTKIYF